jgi:hypothetical protein
MKLPVVSGARAVKAFRGIGYEVECRKAATSSSATPSLRTAGSPCRIIRNLPREPFGH